MVVVGRDSVACTAGSFNFYQSQTHNIKITKNASVKQQKYLIKFSLNAARALQNPSLSKGERKMANLEIYNFGHVVISHLVTLSITLWKKQLINKTA